MRGKTSKKTGKEGKKSVKVRAQKSKVSSPPRQSRKGSTPQGNGSKVGHAPRKKSLQKILLAKREVLLQEMQVQLGQSLTDEQQRRLEAAMDSGDQALVDLEREMGISLQEMRNRERRMIDDALASLEEGTYGRCAECDADISEKRLVALPFARYCVECQSRLELLEKIEKGEQRV